MGANSFLQSLLRKNLFWLTATLVLLLVVTSGTNLNGNRNPDGLNLTQPTHVQAMMADLPLSFIANAGQNDPEVRFHVKAADHTIFFTSDEVVFSTFHRLQDESVASSVVRLSFVEANPAPTIEGIEKLPGIANFFLGNDPEKWATDVPTYGAVIYQDLYPGIDMVYRGTEGRLKSEFIVAPGTDPTLILLEYTGLNSMMLGEDGSLALQTDLGELVETAPVVYQDIAGQRVGVDGRYVLLGGGRVGFQVGAHNAAYALIIDPDIEYSTFLGGSGFDSAISMVVDDLGIMYLSVNTQSVNMPTTSGAFSTTFSGDTDIYLAKLNASGSALLSATYLGGTERDNSAGLTIDDSGNVYVAGVTKSTDFPTTTGAFDTTLDGFNDNVVAKLDSNLSNLIFATYLGGTAAEGGGEISVDGSGSVYVAGHTRSTDFPTTAGAFDTSHNGDQDSFIAKLDSSGSNLIYATFLGGSSTEFTFDIAVDNLGKAYLAGLTFSSDFPTTAGAFDTIAGGSADNFVASLDSSGSTLVYSTFLGGTSTESSISITLNQSGNVYAAGETDSTDFPTTSGAFDTSHNGGTDVYVTKLDTTGANLLFATLLGGSSFDGAKDIAVDGSGIIYVGGTTRSSDIPLQAALDSTLNGSSDAYVAKLDATGSNVLFATFLGGNSTDGVSAIDIDEVGNVYVAGNTSSTDFPVTVGAFDVTHNGVVDVFAAKLSTVLANQEPVANAGGSYQGDEGSAIQLDGTGSSDPDSDPLTFSWSGEPTGCNYSPNAAVVAPTITCDDDASFNVTLTVSDGVNPSVSDTALVTVNNVAPTITSVAVPLAPVNINDQSSFMADVIFTDPAGVNDELYTCDFDMDSDFTNDITVTGVTGTSCSATLNYSEPGVYSVTVTVTDTDGGISDPVTATEFIVIYDPSGGFVTGGGWINSPAGACPVFCDDATGKANFGFVSKYKKGGTVPTGQTEFNFKAGDLNFHSTSYDWLVIAGKKAMYKGDGTVNSDAGFTFQLNAIDGDLPGGDGIDKFRIKIKQTAGGVIYDNQMGAGDNDDPTTALGGGSIKIHKGN